MQAALTALPVTNTNDTMCPEMSAKTAVRSSCLAGLTLNTALRVLYGPRARQWQPWGICPSPATWHAGLSPYLSSKGSRWASGCEGCLSVFPPGSAQSPNGAQ